MAGKRRKINPPTKPPKTQSGNQAVNGENQGKKNQKDQNESSPPAPANSTTTTSDRDPLSRSLQKPSPVATLATAQSQISQKLAKPDKARKKLADLVETQELTNSPSSYPHKLVHRHTILQTHSRPSKFCKFTKLKSSKARNSTVTFTPLESSKARLLTKLAKARKATFALLTVAPEFANLKVSPNSLAISILKTR